MSKERASFTSDAVTILLTILPDHVSPAGGKTDLECVASTCPVVDTDSEKWKAFVKRYKFIATVFLRTPLQNEVEWDKILRSGYASGERSYTPASIAIANANASDKEVVTIEAESSGDSEFIANATIRIMITCLPFLLLTL